MKQMIDLLQGYEEVDAPEIKPETAMDLNLEKQKILKSQKKIKNQVYLEFYRCIF